MGQQIDLADLKKEVESWKNQNIIDDYQAQEILSKYGLAEKPAESERPAKQEDKPSKLITVVSVLGALLIGIGVILLVASNWSGIPDFLKLLLLFGTTFAMYYAGWRMRFETKSHPKVGHALLFLASILVGATIFLASQIFNVNANAHWLVFLWFLAILPFAYAFESKPILLLNIFTFALWMVLYISIRGVVPGPVAILALYLLFGISLYGIGQMHARIEKYSQFRLTYQGIGLFFILGIYFFFSFDFMYNELFRDAKITGTDWTVQLLFILFFIISLASVIVSTIKSDKFKTVKYEFYLLILAFLGALGILALTLFYKAFTITTTTGYGFTRTSLEPGTATMLFIGFNLLFFILSLGSILIGYYRGAAPFINIGVFFFALGVLHLYFTMSFDLLPRGIAFIVGGIVLLAGGWYLEKKRRVLIKEAEAHKNG